MSCKISLYPLQGHSPLNTYSSEGQRLGRSACCLSANVCRAWGRVSSACHEHTTACPCAMTVLAQLQVSANIQQRSLACITAVSAALSLRASSARSWKLMVVSPIWNDSACAGPAAGRAGRLLFARPAKQARAGQAAPATQLSLTLCCAEHAQRPPDCMLPAHGSAAEGAAGAGCRKRCTRHRVAAAGLGWVSAALQTSRRTSR